MNLFLDYGELKSDLFDPLSGEIHQIYLHSICILTSSVYRVLNTVKIICFKILFFSYKINLFLKMNIYGNCNKQVHCSDSLKQTSYLWEDWLNLELLSRSSEKLLPAKEHWLNWISRPEFRLTKSNHFCCSTSPSSSSPPLIPGPVNLSPMMAKNKFFSFFLFFIIIQDIKPSSSSI